MEAKKENKKGFWASLFSPKSCSCSCSNNLIVEEPEKQESSCSCGNKTATPAVNVKEIKVLGPGCAKCKSTYHVIEKVITENNLDVKLTKIEDITEIMSYNIMATPAVMADGAVKIKGHIPSESEVKQLLGI
ncbi:MAG: TM0996/MTH895 family glutaredoxin-like protein [Prevotella sp.]|nr:TM0996/MTH895 family glutaredoxin-like protein [Prevotella sp.]